MTSERIEHVLASLTRGAPEVTATALSQHSPDELATWLTGRSAASALHTLRSLDAQRAARVLLAMPAAEAAAALSAADTRDVFRWLPIMRADARSEFLERLPAGVKSEMERLLDLPVDSVRRYLEPQPIRITAGMTARALRRRLRDIGGDVARTLYTVDANDRLTGELDLQVLALAEEADAIERLTRPVELTIADTADRESVVSAVERSQLPVLPVVEDDNRFLGVIRHASMVRAVEEESYADVQTMVGAGKDERALSPPWFAVRKRHPWLQVNLLTAFLAASVVGMFESTIAQFTALAVLLPVVAGQSGNAGSQALAVTIRGLALREVGTSAWRRVLAKEMWAGVLNGVGIALTTSLGVLVWSRSPGLAAVIAISMVLSMLAAGIAGATIPVLMVRLGQDPATSSSIILTTVTDVTGFLSFLGIATILAFLL